MFGPSPLLSDIGSGPDTVTIFPMVNPPEQDAEGNPIYRPAATGIDYPAIVEMTPGATQPGDGTELSILTYSVTIYGRDRPDITNHDPMVYRGRTLVANSDPARSGPDAWYFTATETGSATDSGYPYGYGME